MACMPQIGTIMLSPCQEAALLLANKCQTMTSIGRHGSYFEPFSRFLQQALMSHLPCSKLRMCQLSKGEASTFYEVHKDKPFFEKLTDFMSSGNIVALELVAKSAIGKWRGLIGPTNSETARKEAPESLRAKFGTDNTQNACHGSDAPDTAAAV